MISYEPLWNTMKNKNITQYNLLQSGIDNRLLSSLKHNRNITLNSLERICLICRCTPNDVVEFTPEMAEGVDLLQEGIEPTDILKSQDISDIKEKQKE